MGQSSAEMACLLWTPCRCLNYLKCALTACTAVQWIGLWSGCYGFDTDHTPGMTMPANTTHVTLNTPCNKKHG